ncbi:hypothetical protein D9611_009043 [Ephemerocybe angulata]|uniref:Uncharacterized protein n=1 Tax=Ephemerocybe angulata TaxID=980116 RepID=A0A8H5CG18_9AGAR|nr:hypothetical protein D9611_009043 [Tulosesus angulatus]
MDSLAFPQELVDHIIDDMRNEPASLAAAGLLGRQWYHRSRLHLFYNVKLGTGKRTRQLKRLIARRPFLVECIRMLTLFHCDSWLASCRHISGVLRTLWLLGGLAIEGGRLLDWDSLSNQLQHFLYKSMANRVLEWLSLSSISNFDISPISQYSNLTTLRLDMVTLASRSSSASGACFPLSQNKIPDSALTADTPRPAGDLYVLGCGDALRTLLVCAGTAEGPLPPYLCPKVLYIGAAVDDVDMNEASENLVDLYCATVEQYTISEDVNAEPVEIDHEPGPSEALFAFTHFPRLLELTVHVNYHDYNPDDHPILPLLLQGLEDLANTATNTPISSLTIDFDSYTNPEYFSDLDIAIKDFSHLTGGMFWAELDDILSQPVFSKLEAVTVIFDLTGNPILRDAAEACAPLLLEQMKNLSGGRGIVNVEA